MNAHITGKKREEIFGLFVHLSISPVSHNTAQFDMQGKVGMVVSNAPGNNRRNDKLQQPVGAWTNRASSRRLYIILNSCSSSILTHSSQPSSFCSPAGRCWASAPCTRVWCPPWQPASLEGSWMTGRYVLGAPPACAVPSLRSACREVSSKGSQLTGTSLTLSDESKLHQASRAYFGTWGPKMASKSSSISSLLVTEGSSSTWR